MVSTQQLDHADIQGLVVSGYNHLPFGCYLFLKFNDGDKGKAWLASVHGEVTTAEKWTTDDNGEVIKPPTMMNIGFTYAGLLALVGLKTKLNNFQKPFVEGITDPQRADKVLGDTDQSDPKHWEIGGRDFENGKNPEDLHAIIILLAESADARNTLRDSHLKRLDDHDITVVAVQTAEKLYDNKEHFGFMDGVSQPRLEDSHRKPSKSDPAIRAGEFILGYRNEYGQYPTLPDINGDNSIGHNGTYLVFRKLYQDVAGFWNFMAETAETEGERLIPGTTSTDRMLWLAAKCMGRWPSGVPLTMAPDADDPSIDSADINHFLYAKRDLHGLKCPLGSHMRRMNPRDSEEPNPEESLKKSNRHMVIRRGLPYGTPLFDAEKGMPTGKIEDDGVDRGLVFLCINANIERQFEFIMQTWANNPKFHALYNDRDPIIGNNTRTEDGNGTGEITIQYAPVRKRIKGIPRFVEVKGGAYFFMPGIRALKFLTQAID